MAGATAAGSAGRRGAGALCRSPACAGRGDLEEPGRIRQSRAALCRAYRLRQSAAAPRDARRSRSHHRSGHPARRRREPQLHFSAQSRTRRSGSSMSIPMVGRSAAIIRTDLGIIADPAALLEALAASPASFRRPRGVDLRQRFHPRIPGSSFRPSPEDGVDFGEVVTALAAQAPRNAVFTTDAGNMSTWVHRHWHMTPANLLIGAIAGCHGFRRAGRRGGGTGRSLPHGDRVRRRRRGADDRAGTRHRHQYGARIKIVISDNGSYGTIRTHQERHYPRRVSGTDLVNPDFSAWAASFGAQAVSIAHGDDVERQGRRGAGP